MKYIFLLSGVLLLSCNSVQPNSAPKTTIDETAEFVTLMEKDAIGKKERTAEALTLIMNDNPKETKVSIRFINNTNCDLILRIFGSKDYLLPIKKKDKNFVILEKGYYNVKYYTCQNVNTEHFNFTTSSSYTIEDKK